MVTRGLAVVERASMVIKMLDLVNQSLKKKGKRKFSSKLWADHLRAGGSAWF